MEYLKLFSSHTDYEDYASGGTMVRPNVSYCEDVKDVHYNPIPHDYSQDYFTIEALDDGTITFTIGSNVTTSDLALMSYSKDNGESWSTTNNVNNQEVEISVSVSEGDKVLWKGEGNRLSIASGTQNFSKFSSTNNINVMGNIMSLIYGDDFKNQVSLSGKNYCFCYLFNGATHLISAENLSLPATTLAEGCYSSMFGDCASLTTAPQLPATTLAEHCYLFMFNGCTSLTSAPTLNATTLANYCYEFMFYGCTSLTSAPQLLATTLASNCYGGMFGGCTNLTSAQTILPATTLAEFCYESMFDGCTSLTTAPQLLATTLVEGCYELMFNGCTSLNYIKAMFTTEPSETYTSGWVDGVAASGTFVKNSAATWATTGVNGIPNGWTVQTA